MSNRGQAIYMLCLLSACLIARHYNLLWQEMYGITLAIALIFLVRQALRAKEGFLRRYWIMRWIEENEFGVLITLMPICLGIVSKIAGD